MSEEQKNEEPEGFTPEGFTEEELEAAEQEEETVEQSDGAIIAELQSEVAVLKDRLLRAVAETENVRRRAEKDKTDASVYAVTGFARDMLNVGDNLRRALDTRPEDISDDFKGFVEGVEMTERELQNIMERFSIKKIEPEIGEKFNHKFHQAMFEVPTEEHAPGHVMQVVAPGYVIKDRLLRPAMVGVSKGEVKTLDTEA